MAGLIAFVCSSRPAAKSHSAEPRTWPAYERESFGQRGSKICQHPFDCLAVIQKEGGDGDGRERMRRRKR